MHQKGKIRKADSLQVQAKGVMKRVRLTGFVVLWVVPKK
jgi:hypothetical protein